MAINDFGGIIFFYIKTQDMIMICGLNLVKHTKKNSSDWIIWALFCQDLCASNLNDKWGIFLCLIDSEWLLKFILIIVFLLSLELTDF